MKDFYSLSEIRSEIAKGHVTVVDLTESHLAEIDEKNGRLNAFLSVFKEEAIEKAQLIDRKIAEGTAGKLAGMIVGIKDVFCYKNHQLSCGSKILAGFESQFTATCVQRLMDEDAIIIGRQNCDEFAMGSTNEHSAFGPVSNPVDESRVPGGSSGGSACAVAVNMCQVSIGSDTGGSVRQPASFCGRIGLKPTYGRISRYGLTSYASSFDTVGIVSKSVEDAAMVLQVIAGKDEMDSTSSSEPVSSLFPIEEKKSYRIGMLTDTLNDPHLQDGVKTAAVEFGEKLKKLGHEVTEVELSYKEYLLPIYYVLTTAEASSNLSRYDGVRFGFRQNADQIDDMFKQTRSEGFGEEVKRRIMTGTFVTSASYHDAYYLQAQKVRRLIKQEIETLFSTCDFLLSPTTPATALKKGEVSSDPIRMYLEDQFTVLANVAGIPAISIPSGKDKQGLPIGIQLMAKAFNEPDLINISNQMTSFQG